MARLLPRQSVRSFGADDRVAEAGGQGGERPVDGARVPAVERDPDPVVGGVGVGVRPDVDAREGRHHVVHGPGNLPLAGPRVERARVDRGGAVQLAHGLELAPEDRRDAGEDPDVADDNHRPRGAGARRLRAVLEPRPRGDVGHAQVPLMQPFAEARAQQPLELGVAHERHPERRGDGGQRDVVVGRADPPRREQGVEAGGERAHAGRDVVDVVGYDLDACLRVYVLLVVMRLTLGKRGTDDFYEYETWHSVGMPLKKTKHRLALMALDDLMGTDFCSDEDGVSDDEDDASYPGITSSGYAWEVRQTL